MIPLASHPFKRAAWLVCLLAVQVGAAAAAEPDKRLNQAREQTRQAQAALQQSQQEKVALQGERDKLQAERDKIEAAQRQASGQQQRLAAELAALRSERDKLAQGLETERSERQRGEQALQEQTGRLEQSQRELADQRRVTASVTELLRRNIQSLAQAEASQARLHGLGLQAVQAYLDSTPEAVRAHDEPFLGLAAVRLGSEAEQMRRALDEALRPTPAQ